MRKILMIALLAGASMLALAEQKAAKLNVQLSVYKDVANGGQNNSNSVLVFAAEGTNGGFNGQSEFTQFTIGRWRTADFGFSGPIASVTKMVLRMTERKSSWRDTGPFRVVATSNNGLDLDANTSPLRFDTDFLPTGVGAQLNPFFNLGEFTYDRNSSTPSGGKYDYDLDVTNPAWQAHLVSQINNVNGSIILGLAPLNEQVATALQGIANSDTGVWPELIIDVTLASIQPETIAPDALTLQRGQIISGTIADLATDNNVALRLKKFFVANPVEPFVWGTLQGTTSILNPSSVTFRVKSRMVTGGQFRQELEQWNWNTSTYENLLNTNPFNTVYGTRESVANPATGKVNGSGRLQARIRTFPNGISANPLPEVDWDLVNWIVNP
ncbi:MAG: hypothetical protein KF884_01780 [Fimbriimonadaceae bacterium]|nr:MAG: hypothetical protein KF884_01780 [Fimbriimonadaceae bacterium]